MIIFDDFIDAQPVMINAKGDPKMNDPKMNEPSTSKVKELKTKAGEQKKKARKGMNDFQWFAMQVLIFVIILYVLFAHIVGITTMPNADMYPRIDSGDFLMFYRLDRDPKAQDVVVFEKNLIMRKMNMICGDLMRKMLQYIMVKEEPNQKKNGYMIIF